MSAFPNWQSFVVPQKHPDSGCIPWSYELLLRAHGVSGINFSAFQEDFDLDLGVPRTAPHQNNFRSVADAVNARYSNVSFTHRSFSSGVDKLQFVESRIVARQPTVVSLCTQGWTGRTQDAGAYHIMPLVDADVSSLYFLHSALSLGTGVLMQMLQLPKTELVRIHDSFHGGDDVAYLDQP